MLYTLPEHLRAKAECMPVIGANYRIVTCHFDDGTNLPGMVLFTDGDLVICETEWPEGAELINLS